MNDLNGYILVVKGAFTPALCDAILKEYVDSGDWVDTVIGKDSSIDKTIRNCSTIGMSFSDIIAKNESVRSMLDKYMHVSVGEIIRKYTEKFPACLVDQDTGYELLRYTEGQFYTEHTDSFKERPRAVTASIVLNEDFEGGEFSFFGSSSVYKLAKGDAIVFPSNFMYPHAVMPVTKGIRYSVVTWFI